MTVNKTNGFAAPYRSLTLRKEKKALVQRNGLLSIDGKIQEVGLNVVVPAFSFLQSGMVVEKTTTTNAPKPTLLVAPYYLTVSAQSSINIDDLSFQFVKSPLDINEQVTILAEYDGSAWRHYQIVSIEGLINEASQEVIDTKKVGPYEGVLTSISGPNFLTGRGLVYDMTGERVLFENDIAFPTVANDPEAGWRRVDRVVYRRALDDKYRIGSRRFFTGGTFTSGSRVINQGNIATSITANGKSKCVVSSDNSIHTIYANGFGGVFSLNYKKLAVDRTTVTASSTIALNITTDQFDIAISNSNQIHLTYVNNDRLFLIILDSSGNILVGPSSLESLPNPCSNPKISIDPSNQRVFVAFEYLESVGLKQIYLTTRSLGGALVKAATRITLTVTPTTEPDIFVSDDLLIHLVYTQSNNVYFQKLDDDFNAIITATLLSTSVGSLSYGTLNGQAHKPQVRVADNMEVFVSFLIRKTLTDYAITVWEERTQKAFCFDLESNTENISDYFFSVSSINNDFYFTYLNDLSEVRFAVSKDYLTVMNESLSIVNALSVHGLKDKQGSMFHLWTQQLPGTYSNTGGLLSIEGIGTLGVAGSLSSIVLSDSQFYMPYNTVVQKDMQVILSDSLNGNDGTYLVTNVAPLSINAVNDYLLVTIGSTFSNPESAATYVNIQPQSPDGNAVSFCKSVAEPNELRALTLTVPTSDLLLARISWSGPVILNYIPTTGIGVNSDLFGMYGDIDVDWGATNPNTLTMSNGLRVIDLVHNLNYVVNGGSFALSEGDALYIKMDGVNTTITPLIAPIAALPWALPIQVLGFIQNGEFNPHLFAVAGMGQLDVGEEIVLGQDLDKKIRTKLGTTMVPYTSTTVIASSDSYPNAISKLDQAFAVMMLEQAVEFTTTTLNDTTTDITTTLDFDPSNAFVDIVVYLNGIKQQQGATHDYIKLDNQTIQFTSALPNNAKVTVRDERTGVPPVGGGTDLTNIAVDMQPVSNGFVSVGSIAKGFKDIYVKDKLSNQVYRLEISNGTFQIIPV
jgi:hypothetical protein